MRKHVGNDELLRYQLDLLEKRKVQSIRTHLDECKRCASLLVTVEDDLRIIKGFDPAVEVVVPPLPVARPGRIRSFLRIAAILALGFLLGALTSESLRSPSVDVVPQHFVGRPPAMTVGQFTVCP